MFYILDEIDAALDEENQAIVGKAITQIFKNSQVLSISHNPNFQKTASRTIFIDKVDGCSIAKKIITKV